MAVGTQDILTFLVEELHQHRVLLVEIAPEWELRLQDDTQFVGSDEGCLRRTPGVETDMVQTIGIASAKVLLPRFHIHSDVSCQWPDAGIVLATKEDLMPIGIEMLSLDMEILEVGVDLLHL